jgi:hypothetical protein
MIVTGAKKLLGGASVALEAVVGAVRHVAWYVSYRVEGSTRERERGSGDGD